MQSVPKGFALHDKPVSLCRGRRSFVSSFRNSISERQLSAQLHCVEADLPPQIGQRSHGNENVPKTGFSFPVFTEKNALRFPFPRYTVETGNEGRNHPRTGLICHGHCGKEAGVLTSPNARVTGKSLLDIADESRVPYPFRSPALCAKSAGERSDGKTHAAFAASAFRRFPKRIHFLRAFPCPLVCACFQFPS